MKRTFLSRAALAVMLGAVLLAGCGGGDPRDATTAFVAGIAKRPAATSFERLAATEVVTEDEVLDWAEFQFPDLFPKGPTSFPLVYEGVSYTVREYVTGNYLGITPDGRIFGLGPFTNNVLTQFNDIAHWSPQVIADRCNIYPGLCVQPVTGYNECIGPEWIALPTGFRTVLTFVDAGSGSFEVTVDSVIDGPATFEGRSAVQSTSRGSTTLIDGGVRTAYGSYVGQSYEQKVAGGVPLMLGSVDTMTTPDIVIPGLPPFPGTTSRSRTVYDPPVQAVEFTLAVGQSVTRTERTTTVDLDGVTPPSSDVDTRTYTYEQRETITVLDKAFDTCRYKVVGAAEDGETTVWYVVGKGVPVRSLTTVDGETSTQELRPPSSYGGQSLF